MDAGRRNRAAQWPNGHKTNAWGDVGLPGRLAPLGREGLPAGPLAEALGEVALGDRLGVAALGEGLAEPLRLAKALGVAELAEGLGVAGLAEALGEAALADGDAFALRLSVRLDEGSEGVPCDWVPAALTGWPREGLGADAQLAWAATYRTARPLHPNPTLAPHSPPTA